MFISHPDPNSRGRARVPRQDPGHKGGGASRMHQKGRGLRGGPQYHMSLPQYLMWLPQYQYLKLLA